MPSNTGRPAAASLRRLYLEHRLTGGQIAARFGVSVGTAYRWLADVGIERRGPGGKDAPGRPSVAALRHMYSAGMTIGEIARSAGVRDATMRTWLVEAGQEIRPPGGQPGRGALPRPPADRLRRWYVDELMSTAEIAGNWNVAESTILRWLRDAAVPLRPCGRSLQARGLDPPTSQELNQLVWLEHRSYREIAAAYGADPSAVMHWLKKYNIQRPTTWQTRRNGQDPELPAPDVLQSRYEAGESLRAIANDYPVSWQTIRDLAIDFGMQLRPTGWYFGPPIECADGHLVRSTFEKTIDDWLSDHGLAHEVEPPVPFSTRWRADFKVGDRYLEVWGVRGQAQYDDRKRAKVAADSGRLIGHHYVHNFGHQVMGVCRLGGVLR